MDSEAEVRTKAGTRSSLTMHSESRRMRNDIFIMSHSLQLTAEDCRKIHKPKIQKLKGGYSANAMLVFNSWLKNVEMCIRAKINQSGSSPACEGLYTQAWIIQAHLF